jgi:transposase
MSAMYTSQMRSQRGHIERANRKSQSDFECRRCGFEALADYNSIPGSLADHPAPATEVSE